MAMWTCRPKNALRTGIVLAHRQALDCRRRRTHLPPASRPAPRVQSCDTRRTRPRGRKCVCTSSPAWVRRQPGVSHTRPARHGDLDHRRPIAGPDAADAFHRGVHAALRQALLQGMKDPIRSFRQAARVEADLDLGAAIAACGGADGWFGGDCALPARQEIADRARHLLGRRVANRLLLDPHHRRERAAAEAGDPLDGESPLGIGVRALGNAQVAAQRVLDPLRPAHVAGRAVAHVDDVLAARLVPEHVVERRDPADRRRRDLRGRADAPQAPPPAGSRNGPAGPEASG